MPQTSSHKERVQAHALHAWGGLVRAHLERSGGSALRSQLAAAVKLPKAIKLKKGNKLKYTAHCGSVASK